MQCKVRENREMRKEQIPLFLQTHNISHLWLCALLTSTDSDGSAQGWQSLPSQTLVPFTSQTCPSTHQCHLSLWMPDHLLSRKIHCYLPAFPIPILSKSTLPSCPLWHFDYATPAGAANQVRPRVFAVSVQEVLWEHQAFDTSF